MDDFTASALTHLLVVADTGLSRDWYVRVLDADVHGEYDDCRATYELLRSRGAAFLTEPVDRSGEIRAFSRDPDGHLFEISEVT